MTSASAAIKPVYVIHGQEAFLRSRAHARVVDEVLGGRKDQLCCAEFDGPEATVADVLDEARTGSLFGGQKLIVVRDADVLISENRGAFERYLDNPSPGAALLLEVKSWPKTTRLYKKAAAIGEAIPCESPKRGQIPGFIVREAKASFNKRLDAGAGRRLQELIGDDLGLLFNELDKLSLFVGSRDAIAVTDIDALCGHWREESIFEITDAMADGQVGLSLSRWRQLVAVDPKAQYRAVGGLTWGIRKLLQARSLADRGTPARQVLRDLRIFSDPAAFERRLGRLPLERLEACMSRLLQADRAAKTGLGDADLQIEKLIVEVATGAGQSDSGSAQRKQGW